MMMAEYIEREAVIKRKHGCDEDTCATCDFAEQGDSWCNGEVFIVDVLGIPAAEVRENVKARWEDDLLDGLPGYRPIVIVCSNCHRVSSARFPFCPNCGARIGGNE